ncbi:hypothetical protein L6452_14515 [Arctium lappa]|uniref:Uncharacterized protein n=1 Tax=Arctium lappa TaxID=4217 RepID=A0ACB9CL42_ARCLA|nr:hypothetical protein L6452_14515 [Arctium lappa]
MAIISCLWSIYVLNIKSYLCFLINLLYIDFLILASTERMEHVEMAKDSKASYCFDENSCLQNHKMKM